MSEPRLQTEEQQVVDAIRQAIGQLHMDDRERVYRIAERFRDEIRRDQLAGMAFALVGAELAAQP